MPTVAMVSLTSLLPGSTPVMVPGAGDVPGSNPESQEPRDVQQPARVPGYRSEGVFSLDGAGEGVSRGAKESGDRTPRVRSTIGGKHP